MWKNTYKDYPPDSPWIQERAQPGEGITGCEMQELNGWGTTFHTPLRKKKRGLLRILLNLLFKYKK